MAESLQLSAVSFQPSAFSFGLVADCGHPRRLDEEVPVRRAAVNWIGAVGYLVRLARPERDEALRRELSDTLGVPTAPPFCPNLSTERCQLPTVDCQLSTVD
jgi:hypothetical protein